jgi:hypothetical protein
MKNKVPKTELEIELTCEKIILQRQVRYLKIHLSAALAVLEEKFKEDNQVNNQNLHQKIPPK